MKKNTNIFGEMMKQGYEEIAEEIKPNYQIAEDNGLYKITAPYTGRQEDVSIKYKNGRLDFDSRFDSYLQEVSDEWQFRPFSVDVGLINTESLYYSVDGDTLIVNYSKEDENK